MKHDTSQRLVTGIAGVIVAGVLAVGLYASVSAPTGEPEFEVTVERIAQLEDGFHVEVSIENTGGAAVEAATIHAEITDGDTVVEEADFDIDWLSPGETMNGAAVFEEDPHDHELTVVVASYVT